MYVSLLPTCPFSAGSLCLKGLTIERQSVCVRESESLMLWVSERVRVVVRQSETESCLDDLLSQRKDSHDTDVNYTEVLGPLEGTL